MKTQLRESSYEVLVTMTEQEARVLLHMAEFSPKLWVQHVSKDYTEEELAPVFSSLRSTMTFLIRALDASRATLRDALQRG